MIDLHMHSTASDGTDTPVQLAGHVKAVGIQIFALTDHDTIDGLKEAVQAGQRCGLRVIPGIELSAREYPTFHILGYGFAPDAPPLAELCRRMRDRRNKRTGLLLSFWRKRVWS